MHMSGVVTSCHITIVPHTEKCIRIVKNMSVCDVDITLAISNPDHITKYATSRDNIMQKRNRARQPFFGLLHVPFFSDAVPPFFESDFEDLDFFINPLFKNQKTTRKRGSLEPPRTHDKKKCFCILNRVTLFFL